MRAATNASFEGEVEQKLPKFLQILQYVQLYFKLFGQLNRITLLAA
jgi:hypothetical protein